MKRNRIVGFGAFGECPEGQIDDNGECLEVAMPSCPEGTSPYNRGTTSDPNWQCEGIGTRVTDGSSSNTYSPGSSFSKAGAGSVGMVGAVIVLGIVGWAAYSIFSK